MGLLCCRLKIRGNGGKIGGGLKGRWKGKRGERLQWQRGLEAFCSLVLFGRREGGAGFGRKGSGLCGEDGRGAKVRGVGGGGVQRLWFLKNIGLGLRFSCVFL